MLEEKELWVHFHQFITFFKSFMKTSTGTLEEYEIYMVRNCAYSGNIYIIVISKFYEVFIIVLGPNHKTTDFYSW